MAIKINSGLRYIGDDYEYIKDFNENPGFNLSLPVSFSGAATITVESLRVTEL